jgi:hypothetical protein
MAAVNSLSKWSAGGFEITHKCENGMHSIMMVTETGMSESLSEGTAFTLGKALTEAARAAGHKSPRKAKEEKA